MSQPNLISSSEIVRGGVILKARPSNNKKNKIRPLSRHL